MRDETSNRPGPGEPSLAVPPERAARVEAAVRAAWRREVRRRKRGRYLWSGAVLAAAGLAGVGIGLRVGGGGGVGDPGGSLPGRVESVSGGVRLRSGPPDSSGSPVPLRAGDPLPPGSEISTLAGGRVALRMAAGESVRLDAGSMLQILSESLLILESGALYFDSGGGSRPRRDGLAIRTAWGTLRHVGTQFEVRLAGESIRIRVREGTIRLEREGESFEIGPGIQWEREAGGATRRREVSPFDPGWLWVESILPRFDLEGRSLQSFLEWVSRERGLRLGYADEALAASAGEIRLQGDIDGLTLDQALDAVLPTCRMTYSVESGVLAIRALEETGVPE